MNQVFQFIHAIRNILVGARRECLSAQEDQRAKAQAADLHHHLGAAQYYRSQCYEIMELEGQLQNVLDQVQENLDRPSTRIYTDMSVLLGIFESNNMVGFTARPFLVRRSVNAARVICENLVRPSGQFLVWFRQVYNLLDTLFQTRTALSMFYHTVHE